MINYIPLYHSLQPIFVHSYDRHSASSYQSHRRTRCRVQMQGLPAWTCTFSTVEINRVMSPRTTTLVIGHLKKMPIKQTCKYIYRVNLVKQHSLNEESSCLPQLQPKSCFLERRGDNECGTWSNHEDKMEPSHPCRFLLKTNTEDKVISSPQGSGYNMYSM